MQDEEEVLLEAVEVGLGVGVLVAEGFDVAFGFAVAAVTDVAVGAVRLKFDEVSAG